MPSRTQITLSPTLTFDALVAALPNAGYRTIAPSGRNVRGAARRGASGVSGRRGMGFACRNC